MKTFGKIILGLITLSLICLTSCSRVEMSRDNTQDEKLLSIMAHASQDGLTKTVLSEDRSDATSFNFVNGDAMGLFAGDILPNKKLKCTDTESGLFEGGFKVSGEAATYHSSIEYYSYYPYSAMAGNNPSALTGNLPYRQRAPFDDQADYLVANPITERYDIDDMPSLNFVFASHLFSIVKLQIINSADEYANDMILSIGLRSNTGKTLAGRFTFDVTQPGLAPVFTNDRSACYSTVSAEFDNAPVLGKNQTHTVYLVVNAGDYAAGELSLEVNTTSHRFTLDTQKSVLLRNTELTSFPVVDVYASPRINEVRRRRLAIFGSSMSGSGFVDEVIQQLGPGWDVYCSSVGGNSMQNTAARQGGLPIVTGMRPFIIPGDSTQSVSIPGLYIQQPGGTYVDVQKETYTNSNSMLNPCLIDGIECEASYENGVVRIRRLTDGEDHVIPAITPVYTYGAREFADVDVLVAQLSYNNGRMTDSMTQLYISIVDKMGEHMTNPNGVMLINGFLSNPTEFPNFWSQAYSDAFTAHFGDHFLDLYLMGGGANTIPLMCEIGQISREEEISETDREYVYRGDWPLSWFVAEGNLHVGPLGRKVMAILLRRRMAELGLL